MQDANARFRYPFPPFGKVQTLARALGISPERLNELAVGAGGLYRAIEVAKKDGSPRPCFDPTRDLKSLQRRIVREIFWRVQFPSWVHGGIKDLQAPRDYVSNARAHVNCRTLINLDISNFFPSVTELTVSKLWRDVFHFPEDVARVLTQLTTYRGSLPQGAPTSNYLASLVFWRTEGRVVEKLAALGFRYTRYVDDITVSHVSDVPDSTISEVIGEIRRMARQQSLRLKKRKTHIARSGDRKVVTGLVVSAKVGAPRKKKSAVRARVQQTRDLFELRPESEEFRRALASATSSVGNLNRLNPGKARPLRSELKAIRSHL